MLTSVKAIHDLPGEMAAKQLPVHLTAEVTFYDAVNKNLFIADSTGGLYVQTTKPYPLHRGDRIEVTGVTAPSFRSNIANDPEIKPLDGLGTLRAKKLDSLSYGELMSGTWDCRYVILHGTIRSALVTERDGNHFLELELLMNGGLVRVYFKYFRLANVSSLLDAEVDLTGVAAASLNKKKQMMHSILYATDTDEDIRIVKAPNLSLSSIPFTGVDDVMKTHSVVDQTTRVRVRGAVTYYWPGRSIVIQQGNKSLYAATRSYQPLPLGTVVDLFGFADNGGYGPSLVQTEVVPTAEVRPVAARPVNYNEAVSGAFSDDLITVRGRIVSQMRSETSETISLIVDKHAVTAVLQVPNGAAAPDALPLNTEVSLTGICRITTGLTGAVTRAPILFLLDMRNRDDLRVLRWPSWWTIPHLLLVTGTLLLVSLVITAWALALRRRVAQQNQRIRSTVRLERERSRLLEAINSDAALDQLLRQINVFVDMLAPGVCCCSTLLDGEPGAAHDAATVIGVAPIGIAYEAPLVDSKGRQVGTFRAGSIYDRPLNEAENKVVQAAASLATLTVNQRRMYEELNYTSSHDQLTTLPNRRSSDAELEIALRNAVRTGSRAGVAYIDVDRFKQVNDEFGHKVGDLYLQQIAVRLSALVLPGDTLARIGGDEFLLIATHVRSTEELEAYQRQLESCFETSFVLEGSRFSGSASIGIALFPDHGQTAEELKKHADFEMYSAKRRIGTEQENRYRSSETTEIFTPADLERAMENGQFRLFYQPQFSSAGKLRGLEALLRLNDPILGMVTPDAFIGVIEKTTLIHSVGSWVIHQALTDAAKWQLHNIEDTRIVVNVSAKQIEHSCFAEEVLTALSRLALPATVLELEITERSVVRDLAQAERQLNRLTAAGVRIAIDDFGMEHSCLGVLHKLPIDTLKIDRSFVRAMKTEPAVVHTIQAIVQMANSLNKRIVAEGVETEAEIASLLKMSDMDLQGFCLGRPQPSEDVTKNLEEWCAGITVNA